MLLVWQIVYRFASEGLAMLYCGNKFSVDISNQFKNNVITLSQQKQQYTLLYEAKQIS